MLHVSAKLWRLFNVITIIWFTFGLFIFKYIFELSCDYSQKKSIQNYLYSAFYDTIVAKQLYRKLRFYNRFIDCRNLIYLPCGKIWLILYTVWWLASSEVLCGVVIVSSQVFSHLRSFKGWIQTEACVIPSYHGMLMHNYRSCCSIQAKIICSTQAKAL